MSRRRVASAIVAVQLLIPTVLLITRGADPLPQAFGWQMYSAHGDRYAAWFVDDLGTETRVDVDSLLLRPRTELRLESALVAHLCDRHADAVAIRIQLGPSSTETDCP